MIKIIFFAVALAASIHYAQANCSNGDTLPETCLPTGCTAQFFLTNLTAIDPYTGLICATHKCFVGGSCPSYAQSGSVLASSQLADKYTGAFAAKIGTDKLDDVCWYNQTLICPEGSCAVDFRIINSTFGIWCTTIQPCPPGFESTSTAIASYLPSQVQLQENEGAVAEYVGTKDTLKDKCIMMLDIGNSYGNV